MDSRALLIFKVAVKFINTTKGQSIFLGLTIVFV